MSQVNLIIEQKATNNKKINTTITNLRESQTSHAEDLAEALVNLTTNTYEGATIEKISNVTESPESPNLPQEISVTYQATSGTYIYTVHRLGTGTISVYSGGSAITVDQSTGTFSYNGAGPFTILVDSDNTYAQGFLIYTRS